MPGVWLARSLACKMKKAHEQVTTGPPIHPAFPARWFSAYTRSPRCTGLVATVAPEKHELLKNLIPASGDQDHTTSPQRSGPRSSCAAESVHRIPRPTSVTIAIRPSSGRETRKGKPLICPTAQAEIFAGRFA